MNAPHERLVEVLPFEQEDSTTTRGLTAMLELEEGGFLIADFWLDGARAGQRDLQGFSWTYASAAKTWERLVGQRMTGHASQQTFRREAQPALSRRKLSVLVGRREPCPRCGALPSFVDFDCSTCGGKRSILRIVERRRS